MRTFATFAVLGLMLAPALASPPPPDSEDARIMAPYADWVRTQHSSSGRWCCDISDGRPVDARIVDGHWQAHITPAHWPGIRDQWITIPEDKVLPGSNPTGTPILWLSTPHKSHSVGNCEHCMVDDGIDPAAEPFVFCFAPTAGM